MCARVNQLLDSHDLQGGVQWESVNIFASMIQIDISRENLEVSCENFKGPDLRQIWNLVQLGERKYPSVNLWLELLCYPGYGVHPDGLAEPVWRRRYKTQSTGNLAEQV